MAAKNIGKVTPILLSSESDNEVRKKLALIRGAYKLYASDSDYRASLVTYIGNVLNLAIKDRTDVENPKVTRF